MNEIEMIEEVQKELSKQYLKVAKLQAENKKLKCLLQDCKQMFIAEKSFLVQCSRMDDINNIVEKINEILK